MSSSLRYCAYCKEPLEGRVDKVYCSSSCKSKDFRRQQAEAVGKQEQNQLRPRTGAASDSHKPYTLISLRSGQDADELEDAFDDEVTEKIGNPPAPCQSQQAPLPPSPLLSQQEHLDQVIRREFEQYHLAQLPQQYAACIEQVLAADEHPLNGRALKRLSELVKQTSAAYQRLAQGQDRPAFLASHLQDLYRVEEIIEEANAEWDEEREPVELRLKKKFRAQLRAALAQITRS